MLSLGSNCGSCSEGGEVQAEPAPALHWMAAIDGESASDVDSPRLEAGWAQGRIGGGSSQGSQIEGGSPASTDALGDDGDSAGDEPPVMGEVDALADVAEDAAAETPPS